MNFFKDINGFIGLYGYGGDEQLLSMKTWMAGGSVAVRDDLQTLHINQDHRNVKIDRLIALHNLLFIERCLMTDREWFEFVECIPWYLIPAVQIVENRNWQLPFEKLVSPDDILARFGGQSVKEAISLMRQFSLTEG